jgi:hypothetical protein
MADGKAFPTLWLTRGGELAMNAPHLSYNLAFTGGFTVSVTLPRTTSPRASRRRPKVWRTLPAAV